MKNILMQQLRLCFVTNIKGDFTGYSKIIQKAVLGGVTMVQFRAKNHDEQLETQALFLKDLLSRYERKIPLIINDHVELAAKIGADGVHIGPQDMPVQRAREILGNNKIIGYSIESVDELHKANKQPFDYVTASAVYPSRTKSDSKKIWGIEQLNKLTKESYHPITAIGGINIDNIPEVFKAGVCGVAVIGAIDRAPDSYEAAQELITSANHWCNEEII